jgi:hypothetical protein
MEGRIVNHFSFSQYMTDVQRWLLFSRPEKSEAAITQPHQEKLTKKQNPPNRLS